MAEAFFGDNRGAGPHDYFYQSSRFNPQQPSTKDKLISTTDNRRKQGLCGGAKSRTCFTVANSGNRKLPAETARNISMHDIIDDLELLSMGLKPFWLHRTAWWLSRDRVAASSALNDKFLIALTSV